MANTLFSKKISQIQTMSAASLPGTNPVKRYKNILFLQSAIIYANKLTNGTAPVLASHFFSHKFSLPGTVGNGIR
ncbi:hypothetical protein [Thermoactinomyces mirandus]|uniref:hypothetical protein n=1 Tax=Thermoactinomyces mirandus TaxID=2756294 RepID=UPI0015EF436B|nr:hypothetical protein [Thermoactinomyces mirandus]